MSNRNWLLVIAIVAIVFISLPFIFNKKTSNIKASDDVRFKDYIAAHTGGYISANSNVKVVLAEAFPGAVIGEEAKGDFFEFSPSLTGKTVWINDRTLEFIPTEKLEKGKLYSASFHLGKIKGVAKELSDFNFGFKVIPQNFDWQIDDYVVKTNDLVNVKGHISFTDDAENKAVESMLQLSSGISGSEVIWDHKNAKEHVFTIQNIKKKDAAEELAIEVTGKAIGLDKTSSQSFSLPAIKEHKVLKVNVINEPNQYVSVQFSHPLKSSQDLAGLINIQDAGEVNTAISNNELKIYLPAHINGAHQLSLNDGIKDADGNSFSSYFTSLNFSDLKPKLEMSSKGNILPKGSELLFPFEAINLKSVTIKVSQVYERNILQFLQVNEMDGQRELKRVGKTILKKKIDLNTNGIVLKDKWNNYSVDLSQLIKTEPGAIYNVSLSFRKSDAICDCTEDTLNLNSEGDQEYTEGEQPEADFDEEKDWEYYNSYYDYDDDYYYYYDYSQRENECSNAYYSGKTQVRNVLATDIGLIAKRGNDGSIDVFANSIFDIKPLSAVHIEAYDFHGRLVAKGETNADGHVQITTKAKPFVLIAKHNEERNYIKLSDANALMLSNFDVSGEVIQKGLKGFIYGERGVWRPGDSVYLSFILDDSKRPIPKDAPVVFELINPKGGIVQRIVKSNHLNRFYNFALATGSDDITGLYAANVKVGGATFSKSIRIETIMPNRLKLKLDFGKEELKAADKNVAGNLQVNWLHGAPGRNLNTQTEMYLTVDKTEFKNYKDYIFQDDNIYFYSEQKLVSSVFTNDSGAANVNFDVTLPEVVPGKLKANFTIKAFEDGGAYSIDRFSVPYSPFENYVGLKMPEPNKETGYLETDMNHVLKIAVVNENGQASGSERLHLKLFKLSWRYWWESGGDDYTGYLNGTYYQPVVDTFLNTNGANTINYVMKVASNNWGRYLISVKDENGGHVVSQTTFFDWPAWAGKSPKGNEGATLLMFNTDKTEYKAGESINLKIPSTAGGKALITIENGSRVIETKWVNTVAGNTDVSIKATEEMLPNAYVSIAMIQPHGKWNNDLPLRLYGVQNINVTDENKKLEPLITSADVWQPNQKVNVQVKEKNGKAMTYTLAIVDEGLLDITRFKTPNPYNSFYAREALGIKTWDVYDNVIGGFSKGLRRILSIGGDGSGDKDGGNKANRFKAMVRFIGPFEIGKGGSKSHDITIPNYIGSVKIMVVAGQNLAYGAAEKTIPVRKPLMVLGTLPRVVSVGEEVELPVTVFAMEKKIKNAVVKITTDNHFTALNGSSSNVTFTSIGDKVIPFKYKVNATTGIAKIKIQVSGNGESAEDNIEIDVRQPNEKQTKSDDLILSGNKGLSINYQPLGIAGSNTAYIELSSLMPINLGYRINYLLEYPHGCIEQTTSPGFAQLQLKNILDLNTSQLKTTEINIKAAINRIKSFQTMTGGLSYWPGENEPSEWGTNYAFHFLLEAQANGYSVPFGLIENIKKYQQNRATVWTSSKTGYNDDITQSYRLYTLALAGKADLASMNRLKEYKLLSQQAKWRLAAAYAVSGQKTVAASLITSLSTKVNKYVDSYYTYGDNNRDAAMILEALVLLGDKNKAAALAKEVSQSLSNDTYYLSTQSAAYSIIALSKYYGLVGQSSGIDVDLKIAGKTVALKSTKAILTYELEANSNIAATLELNNKAKGTLYAKVIRRGVPALGTEQAYNNTITCNITYKNANGVPIDVETLKQGTTFYAEVSIYNAGINRYLSQLALSQVFPAGWEIASGRIDDATLNIKYATPTYMDVRDDRVYQYFDMGSGSTKTFAVKLQAAYRGKFYLPATKVECMYDNTVSAATKGKWVNVVGY
jgi:alpha-2-macroglobulin